MTGNGSRFKEAGYKDLKPLISVQGVPMVTWVTSMFDQENDEFIFICREEHLNEISNMKTILQESVKKSRIVSLKDWNKLGPAADVLRIGDEVKKDEPCIISYCDYFMRWDYAKFLQEVISRQCHGAIPCYNGFHPHLAYLDNLYASCKVDKSNNLIEIKEKHAWNNDRFNNLNSPGAYYFASIELMNKYIKEMMEAKDMLGGEYYASLIFNYMAKDNLEVWCPDNIEYFCQWGTPRDLNEYLFWEQAMNTRELQ